MGDAEYDFGFLTQMMALRPSMILLFGKRASFMAMRKSFIRKSGPRSMRAFKIVGSMLYLFSESFVLVLFLFGTKPKIGCGSSTFCLRRSNSRESGHF